jgi:hypothetical protein
MKIAYSDISSASATASGRLTNKEGTDLLGSPSAERELEMATEPLKLFDPTDVKPGDSCSGIVHVCDACGKRGRWNDKWSWYGSLADEDDSVAVKLCGCEQLSQKDALILLKAKRRRIGRPIKIRKD